MYRGKYEAPSCAAGDFTNIVEISTRADIESELYGLNRPGSLCPILKYNPNSSFKPAEFSPPRICESIHYITPNNIEKPKFNMLNMPS